jgi:hypothetical protein
MKNFFKQNYDRHLIYTFVILFFALFRMNFKDAEWFGVLFISTLFAFILNLGREMYYEKFHEAPFDIYDAIYGGIGGALAGIMFILFQ